MIVKFLCSCRYGDDTDKTPERYKGEAEEEEADQRFGRFPSPLTLKTAAAGTIWSAAAGAVAGADSDTDDRGV